MIRLLNIVVEEIARASGKIHLPVSTRRLEYTDGDEIRKLPDGSVLLGHSEWYLCNVMIGGFWKHAAVKVGDQVIEAIGRGVVSTPIGAWVSERDYAAALTPRFGDQDGMAKVARLVETQIGKPYDWEFDIGSRAFYCAELVYWAYRKIYPLMGFELRERLGRLTVTPQDFFDAQKYWKVDYKLPVAETN